MLKVDQLTTTVIMIIALNMLCGCATERDIAPTISESPRSGLELKTPVLAAVFDGRGNQEPRDAASQLQSDIGGIYGSSIEWDNYFNKVPQGGVAVRIRIVTLGSSFGSRIVSSTAFAYAVSSAQVKASGPWGPIVGNVSAQQSVMAGSISAEGWWNGAAWIDLEVQDYRGSAPINFTLPIVAEHRESNVWGYSSGDKAARMAWQQVAVQLIRALDEVLRTVRDQQ